MVGILNKQKITLHVHSWEWTVSWVFKYFLVANIIGHTGLSNQQENTYTQVDITG